MLVTGSLNKEIAASLDARLATNTAAATNRAAPTTPAFAFGNAPGFKPPN